MRVGLIDFGGKIVNLALMKLSAYYKAQGAEVVLNPTSPVGLDMTFVSLIFYKDKDKAISMYRDWPGVVFGGTGFDLAVKLPDEIEGMRPDYDLYTVQDVYSRIANRIAKKEKVLAKAQEIVDAGIGFITRGCVNTEKTCPWCVVPAKEGRIHRVNNVSDIINPRSNKVILLDNSLPTHPDALEIFKEIRERKLVVDITQGIDVRRLTPEMADALASIRHWRSLHYAWDLPAAEKSVLKGIDLLSRFVTKSKHLCYMLCGFESSFEEDMHRVEKLKELGIRPYVMIYQRPDETFDKSDLKTEYARTRLRHFARWVNVPKAIYKTTPFAEYENWVRAQEKFSGAIGAVQMGFGF